MKKWAAFTTPDEIESILDAWRTRALNVILSVLAILALPAVVLPIVNALRAGWWYWWMYTYVIGYLVILALALWRRLNVRVRGWGLLLIGYFVAVMSLARGGMATSGRLYLLWLPVIAVILINVRSGLVTTLLSLLVYGVFTILAQQGVLTNWLTVRDNPVDLRFWIEAGAALAMFLIVVVVLMERFHRLQINTLIAERKASAALKEANLRLEEYSRTLEDKVAQRTQELVAANAQLQAHTHELELRNAELDAFAHTVAHDLKNPLSAMAGWSSLLGARIATMSEQEAREGLQRIEQNSLKMTNIVNELLLLSSVRKLEEVQTEPLDMAAIAGEATERCRALIEERQATLQLPEAWPSAVGYAPWIEEVWANYISNAAKYGGQPSQSVPPQIKLGGEASGEQVRFWVQDNGPGLTAEEQSRLFAPFERLGQTRIQGHGLGLSIVRRIVEKMGGQVGVESSIGRGSTFFFTLPMPTIAPAARPEPCAVL